MSILNRKSEDDWDGNGAKKTDDDVYVVVRIMRDECPHVTATVEGGYRLRWHTRGWNIEIAVNPRECDSPIEITGDAYRIKAGGS